MSEGDASINPFKNNLIYDILKKYDLILLVGTRETNSLILEKFNEILPAAISVNLGYQLSQKLLHEQFEITHNPQIFFDEMLNDKNKEVVLFSNTDILFDHNLSFDPLYIFKKISSKKKLIVTWNGKYEQSNNKLVYANPDHMDYRDYVINNNEVYIINSEGVCHEIF